MKDYSFESQYEQMYAMDIYKIQASHSALMTYHNQYTI